MTTILSLILHPPFLVATFLPKFESPKEESKKPNKIRLVELKTQ